MNYNYVILIIKLNKKILNLQNKRKLIQQLKINYYYFYDHSSTQLSDDKIGFNSEI